MEGLKGSVVSGVVVSGVWCDAENDHQLALENFEYRGVVDPGRRLEIAFILVDFFGLVLSKKQV